MIAGGASLAPRRWSLPAEATVERRSPWCNETARITAVAKVRKRSFACGSWPGSRMLPTAGDPSDQFTCLPEPLTPAKGFSWSSATKPYFGASLRTRVIVSCWWSAATFAVSKIRSQFELGRSDFVVAGLERDAEFEGLALEFHHEGEHAVRNGAEVLVLKLLATGGLRAEERATGGVEVGAQVVEARVDQEVLLLGPGGGGDEAGVLGAEELEEPLRLLVQRVHRTEERGLLVEGLAGPGNEGGRDAERGAVRAFHDVGGRGHVPHGVAARFKGRANAARGERRCVRFALDEGLAGEGRAMVLAWPSLGS